MQLRQAALVATVCGLVQRVNKLVTVQAWRHRYRAEVGDVVVGRVAEVPRGAPAWWAGRAAPLPPAMPPAPLPAAAEGQQVVCAACRLPASAGVSTLQRRWMRRSCCQQSICREACSAGAQRRTNSTCALFTRREI